VAYDDVHHEPDARPRPEDARARRPAAPPNRILRNCERGEAFLAAGDLTAAARAFRAVLAEVGPLEDGSPEGDGGCAAPTTGAGTDSAGGSATARGADADSSPAPDANAETPCGSDSDADRTAVPDADADSTAVPDTDAGTDADTAAGADADTATGADTDAHATAQSPTPTPAHLASRAHIGLGRVALRMEGADRAEREFRRAARLRPGSREPLYWLGCAAAHRGAQDRDAYELAELRFTEVVEQWPGDGASLVQRAHVRVRLGRPADALADLRSAERIAPLDAEARWVLAALSGATAPEVARRLGTAARSAMERAAATGPKGRPRAADDWNRAVTLLDRARQLDPGNREFALPHAVALCLSGRREDGIAVIADAARSAPTDRHLAHTLAVMSWHALAPGDGTDTDAATAAAADTGTDPDTETDPDPDPDTVDDAGEDVPRTWSRCVASWAGLLHDTPFWERLRAGAAERYGVVVDDKNLATLRADLQAALEALMPETGAGDRISPEALLHRETEAARLLAEAGGLPLATGSAPLVCGPLRIVELGREAELGAFVSAAGDAAPALRQAFSHLGFAQALLRLDRPAEALSALSGLRCPRCRARGGSGDEGRRGGGGEQSGGDTASHGRAAAPRAERGAVCDPDCTRFDTRNPAYAGQAAKHVLLMRDGRSLALAARLAQGRAALTPTGPDVRRAATSWQRALTHARAIGQGPEVEAIVADTALAAAKALHRAGDIDAAGSTLESAYALLGEGQHERLKGQLARVLTDRGIAQANRDMDRLEGPAADLRRAVEINPHLHRAQANLGVVLRILGARMRWSGSLVGCRSRLQEALDRVTAALEHFPGDPELSQLRDLVEADLALVHSELEQGRIGGLP
jgi:tetratricopeptide (TPR) repeat protein